MCVYVEMFATTQMLQVDPQEVFRGARVTVLGELPKPIANGGYHDSQTE